MSVKARLLRNIGANAYGQIITVLVQLASVPLFLKAWGVTTYGEWLVLTAIPAYLSMSDIGFSSVAANDMTMKCAAGDYDGAKRVYQSVWVLVCSISIASFGAFVAGLCFADPVRLLSITSMSKSECSGVLLVLVLYVLVNLQFGVLTAPFRAVGRYAFGTSVNNTIRLVEWGISMAVLALNGSAVQLACAMIMVRVLGLFSVLFILKYQIPSFLPGLEFVSRKEVFRLFRPAVAFMAFPLGLSLGLQGMNILIGSVAGGAAVVIFSTYRTLTRVVVQFVTMLNQAAWPELSSAYGVGDFCLLKYIFFRFSRANFLAAFVFVGLLCVFGQWFIRQWTHGAFSQNSTLFALLVAVSFVNVCWQTAWVLLMATNQHQSITGFFLIGSFGALLLSWFLIKWIGVSGAGIALLASEVLIAVFAVRHALSVLNGSWGEFARAHLFARR